MPSPPATPTTVAIDPAVPSWALADARRVQERVAKQLGAQVTDGSGTLRVRLVQPGETPPGPVVSVDYVPVVSRRLLVRDLTWEQLRHIWEGQITDWSELGSPVSHWIVRANYRTSAGPFPKDRAIDDIPNYEHLARWLTHEQRGGIAIIPADEVDFRVRALTIDGVNVLRPGDAPWPLRLPFTIETTDPVLRQGISHVLHSGDRNVTPVSMTWAGDIIIARQVHRRILELGDWAAPFRAIAPELSRADVTVSNLETSLSDSFESIIDPTTFTFKTDTPAVEGLKLAQIDVLSRANNHSFNYGATGMDDTTRVLDAAGILHFGMGRNLEEARRAVVVERGGATYAFLGYNGISDEWGDAATPDSPGTAPLIDWMVVEDIRREVAKGHIVIPFFHWGTEYVYDPNEEQRYFAHIAIDAGAAMVVGSHPHWVQAVETYNGKPIIYSLGNFVFDQEWSLETKQGVIAHVWMEGERVRTIDLVPILIEDYHRPRLMSNAEAWPVLEHIWAASDRIDENG